DERTLARVSDKPNGVAPVNVSLARPSQKLRKLKTAFTTLGALRSPTCRRFNPPARNFGSSMSDPSSDGRPGISPVNLRANIPDEPDRWDGSRTTRED